MINERELEKLGLESYENGYYNIDEDVTVDVEGVIRIEHDYKNIYIAQVYTIDELKLLIKCINRLR